jgi:hypothetical protein
MAGASLRAAVTPNLASGLVEGAGGASRSMATTSGRRASSATCFLLARGEGIDHAVAVVDREGAHALLESPDALGGGGACEGDDHLDALVGAARGELPLEVVRRPGRRRRPLSPSKGPWAAAGHAIAVHSASIIAAVRAARPPSPPARRLSASVPMLGV